MRGANAVRQDGRIVRRRAPHVPPRRCGSRARIARRWSSIWPRTSGPARSRGAVRLTQEMPLDEAQLGKAMYIEYDLPDDPPGRASTLRNSRSSQGRSAADARRPGRPVRRRRQRLADRPRLPASVGQARSTDRRPEGFSCCRTARATGFTRWSSIVRASCGRRNTRHATDRPEASARPQPEDGEVGGEDPAGSGQRGPQPGQVGAVDGASTRRATSTSAGSWAERSAGTTARRGKVQVFPIPEHSAIVYGVVVDRNDNVFVALWNSGHIAKFDASNHQWTIFTPPTHPGQTRRLSVDAQNNIWLGIYSAGKRAGKVGQAGSDDRQDHRDHDPAARHATVRRPAGCRGQHLGGRRRRDGGLDLEVSIRARSVHAVSETAGERGLAEDSGDAGRRGVVSPRGSQRAPAISVLYPDMDKVTTLGAHYVNGPPGYPYKPAAQPRSTQ